MANQPVLLTGASGFIGGRLLGRLIARTGQVFCLVRAGSRVAERSFTGAQRIIGDVTDPGSVRRAIAESQAGVVFHAAGLVRALRRDDFARVNAGGVEIVAAACAEHATPPVLVVLSSLAAAGPHATDELSAESDDPAPASCYGRSKLAGERAAAKYAGAAPITIVRPPIVFGPGDRAVLEIFRPIARHGLHVVPGWGSDRRVSLVHLDDLVEGVVLAAEKGERMSPHGPPGQGVYYIAGEETPTYAQLGQAIAVALGRKPPTIVRVPGPLLKLAGIGGDMMSRIRRRPGWINSDKMTEALAGSWTCTAAKARAQLGWAPAVGLADRLRETAQWYRQHGWL